MLEEQLTEQQIVDSTVRAARDSVWVINNEIEGKSDSGQLRPQGRDNIKRNVEHLELVISDPKILELGGDLSDLLKAIADGKAELQQ